MCPWLRKIIYDPMHTYILYKTYVHFTSKQYGHVQCTQIPGHHQGPFPTFGSVVFHFEMRRSRF